MTDNVFEVCDYLAFRVSPDYKLVRFKSCVFYESRSELSLTFLYDESIKKNLDALTVRLEQEYKSLINLDIKYSFQYKSSYMDSERLGLLVRSFLADNFSIMTLDIGDDDIRVKYNSADKNSRAFDAEIRLPKHTAEYVKASKTYSNFLQGLREDYFYGFNFSITEKSAADSQSIEDIEKYVRENMKDIKPSGTDKVCKVKNVEYYLGKPIKERPVKIEFLRISPDEQVIAGTMAFLTKREYTKKDTDEKKPYWTFVLDDGAQKQNCVFFPTVNTLPKFEKLVNGTAICAIGVNNERNGRVNFSVKGISFCEMI